jgi:hypothetical protein
MRTWDDEEEIEDVDSNPDGDFIPPTDDENETEEEDED